MKFNELDINIKEYLGIFGTGVIVMLSIIYKSKVYEGVYWYTDEYNILQLPQDIEVDLGKANELSEYDDIMKYLSDNREQYNDVVPKLKDIMKEEEDPQL